MWREIWVDRGPQCCLEHHLYCSLFFFQIKHLQETVHNECEERFELTEALSVAKEELLQLKKPPGNYLLVLVAYLMILITACTKKLAWFGKKKFKTFPILWEQEGWANSVRAYTEFFFWHKQFLGDPQGLIQDSLMGAGGRVIFTKGFRFGNFTWLFVIFFLFFWKFSMKMK